MHISREVVRKIHDEFFGQKVEHSGFLEHNDVIAVLKARIDKELQKLEKDEKDASTSGITGGKSTFSFVGEHVFQRSAACRGSHSHQLHLCNTGFMTYSLARSRCD